MTASPIAGAGAGSALGSRLDARAAEEQRRAARFLLRHPFVTPTQPDSELFLLVRRHANHLTALFDEWLGWRLVVEGSIARLHKIPAGGAVSRPARNRSGTAFDRRRYALFCLVLAVLEPPADQIRLSDLAEQLSLQTAALGVPPFDPDAHADRRAFVDAVRLLVDLGAIALADGDETGYLQGSQGADALYDVDRRMLAQVLSAPVPPSTAPGPESITDRPYPPTDEGRRRRVRHSVVRRLVDEPAVFVDDLDDDARAYLQSQRQRLVRLLADDFGLTAEVRKEGWVAVDANGDCTDITFPTDGTDGHTALLLGARLTERARNGQALVPPSDVRDDCADLLAAYGRFWRGELRDDPDAVATLALDRLEALGLVRLHPAGVEPRPALSRYDPAPGAAP